MSKFSIFVSFFLIPVIAFSQIDSINIQQKTTTELKQSLNLKSSDSIIIVTTVKIIEKKVDSINQQEEVITDLKESDSITIVTTVKILENNVDTINQQEKMLTKLIQPPYLEKGDTIMILAPAGILKNKKETIGKAQKLVESWGLKVVLGENLFNQGKHFAGTDDERMSDFQKALDNKNIKAIWSGRGGYGSVRILDRLDYTEFLKNPKWIIGYSDITAFHNHIHTFGIETIHAMMGTSLQDKPEGIPETIKSFKKAIFGEKITYKIPSSTYNRIGKAEGQLVGGNLSLLASMLGSKSQISTEGKILFIEEIGEYKYSIDRMLQSLKRAGYFENVNGIIVGDMTSIKKNTTSWGSSIEQLILDVVPGNIPILFNFPAGHELDNRALIFGRSVELDINKTNSHVTFKE